MKILFPATNRVHLARQKLLIEELRKLGVEVDVKHFDASGMNMVEKANVTMQYFDEKIFEEKYDMVLIRGDRFEMLPIAMIAAYQGIPVAHIEGGDISGMIDNKVRYAITALADLHFPTNYQAAERLINLGARNVFNFGSLDVEYAKSLSIPDRGWTKFVVVCYHPVKGENPELIVNILEREFDGEVLIVKSNSDEGVSFGDKEYEPDTYIGFLKGAKLLVGNSSSFIKEASVFGTPVVLIGDRQKGRLLTNNIVDVPFDPIVITEAIRSQLGKKYEPSDVYSQEGTSKLMAEEIKKFLIK